MNLLLIIYVYKYPVMIQFLYTCSLQDVPLHGLIYVNKVHFLLKSLIVAQGTWELPITVWLAWSATQQDETHAWLHYWAREQHNYTNHYL